MEAIIHGMSEIEERIYKKYEFRSNDNLLKIRRDNDEITFTLFLGISLYKYTKKINIIK